MYGLECSWSPGGQSTDNVSRTFRQDLIRHHPELIGVSRPPVLDWGTIFHPDYGGRYSPSTPLDNF